MDPLGVLVFAPSVSEYPRQSRETTYHSNYSGNQFRIDDGVLRKRFATKVDLGFARFDDSARLLLIIGLPLGADPPLPSRQIEI